MSNIFDLFKKIETPTAPKVKITHLIAGLGNPGSKYESTRHNAGFLAVDAIAESLSVKINRAKFHARVCECEMKGVGVLLMKPETFMNNSGIAVAEAASFYKIPPENIIILHDEISFDPGIMRIRRKGSAGGHNGLKSIIEHLGSDAFPRIKIGIGKKPSPDYDLADFVLGKFSQEDKEKLRAQHPSVIAATALILCGKIDEAMNKYSK